MDRLRLHAEDAEDLEIVAAHLQDAVALVKDLVYLPKSRRFAAVFNRYRWESGGDRESGERIRCGVHIDGVLAAKSSNILHERSDGVLSLLTMRFLPDDEPPGGIVEMVFSGGGTVRLTIDAIDVHLGDIGEAWSASARPQHTVESGQRK